MTTPNLDNPQSTNGLRAEQQSATGWWRLWQAARRLVGSIRGQVVLLVTLATLPAVGLVVFNSVESRKLEAFKAQEQALRLAEQAAQRYEQLLDSTRYLLMDLAGTPAIRAGTTGQRGALLSQLCREKKLYANLALFDTTGRPLASAVPVTDSTTVADRDYFKRAIVTRSFAVGGYQVDRVTHKASIGCGYPVFDRHGEVQWVVFAALDLAWLNQVARQADLPTESSLTVVDEAGGTILARHPESRRWVGHRILESSVLRRFFAPNPPGTTLGTGMDGIERLYAFTSLKGLTPESAVGLYVGIPLSVAYARANTTLGLNLVLVALVALAAVLTGQAAVGMFFKRHMDPVVAAAARLGAGDFGARCGACRGPVELRRLAGTLDQMAESLQRRQTDREQAEKLLRESEERFRSLTANSPVGVMLTDPQGRCVYANPRCRAIFGVTLMSSLGDGWAHSVHPDDRAQMLQEWNTCVNQRHEFLREFRLQGERGAVRWVQMRSATMSAEVSDLRGHVLVVDEITERKLAEDRLRLQGQALESAANAIVILDCDGHIVWVNPAFTQLTGYTAEEVIGRTPRLFKSGKHPDRFYQVLWETVRAGQLWHGEVINRRKDGSLYTEEMAITPVRDAAGAVSHYIAIKQDVTTRKQAEVALQQSEERYRNLVDNAQDVIFTLSTTGEWLSFNPVFETITGWSREHWLKKPFSELIDPGDMAFAWEIFWRVIHGEQPAPFELRIRARNGKQVIAEITVTPQIHEHELVGILGVARDITERKQLQTELNHRQKMDAVGRLAGGVAHDFNNILTAITGYSELTLRRLDPADPLRHNLDEIYRASGRAAALTHQLLAFSRKQVLQPRVLDLNAVVTGIQKMLSRLITENIELRTDLQAVPSSVKADSGQLEQVIMNLVVNARDAMPDGGRLTIATAATTAPAASDIPPGEYVRLTVTDTGCGMTEEIKARIFEPFFTTKAQGQGTGLGLSTCFGVVEQSGGYMRVDSQPGAGTAFHIYLPRVAAETKPVEDSPARQLPTGSETILVTEDEPAVREFAAGMLRELGYSVLEAGNGEEGQRVAQEFAGRKIDLLFTDVVMPQMGGRELADWFRTARPETKVLFTSGYTTDQQIWRAIREGRTTLLDKPFTPVALAIKVREILDQRS